MSSIATELLLIGCLVLLNGVLAMAEIAIVSARKARLHQQAERGDSGARAALALAKIRRGSYPRCKWASH